MSGNTEFNLSREKQVETQQVTVTNADGLVASFQLGKKVNRLVVHATAAAEFKLTFGINSVAAATATSPATKDGVGYLIPCGARTEPTEFILNEGEYFTEVRGYASAASQTLGYMATTHVKSTAANH